MKTKQIRNRFFVNSSTDWLSNLRVFGNTVSFEYQLSTQPHYQWWVLYQGVMPDYADLNKNKLKWDWLSNNSSTSSRDTVEFNYSPLTPGAIYTLALFKDTTKNAYDLADYIEFVIPKAEKSPDLLDAIVKKITDKVGYPAWGNIRIDRKDMGISRFMRLHLDLGGEGYHEEHSVVSGFKDAINVNARETDSQNPHSKIPYLVYIKSFENLYPFADSFANYITMQGSPLTPNNVNEIERMLKYGGEVGLWID